MQSFKQDTQSILRGVKISLDFNKLFCAFVGIAFSILWVLVIIAFGSAFKLIEITPFEIINRFLISPRLGLCSALHALVSSIKSVEWGEYIVLIVLVLGLMAIWSVFAGAVTRLTAMEFSREEKTGLKDSLSFVIKKFWSYFWSPLTPILGVLFFIACNVAGGMLGKIEYAGEIAVAVGFPLAILSGFLIVFLGIVGVIGFILMFPAISSEGSDAFDAISRAYSYVLSRPIHFLSLFITLIICTAIVSIVVGFGTCLVMQTSYFTVGLGMGEKLNEIRTFITGLSGNGDTTISLNPMSMRLAALLFILYIALIKAIVGSIIITFVGTTSTIVYLIMRKDVDGTEMNDIYIEENVAIEETVPAEQSVQQSPTVPEPIAPSEQKKPENTEEPPKEQ